MRVLPTPAGVAYQIPTGVNSLRDRCRGREPTRARGSGGLALPTRPPATVRASSGGLRAASPLRVLRRPRFLRLCPNFHAVAFVEENRSDDECHQRDADYP